MIQKKFTECPDTMTCDTDLGIHEVLEGVVRLERDELSSEGVQLFGPALILSDGCSPHEPMFG